MSKITDLVTAVSRIPGLSFLRQFNRHIRTAENLKSSVDSFKNKDEKEETKNSEQTEMKAEGQNTEKTEIKTETQNSEKEQQKQ